MFTASTLFVLTCLFGLISAHADINATAGLNTKWIATESAVSSTVSFLDSAVGIPVLLRSLNGSTFACVFYSEASMGFYYFAVLLVPADPDIMFHRSLAPAVVWSANRNRPVGTHSTLELTTDGDLVLKDADGSTAWSTKTSGKHVAGINLTDTGNLVLFNDNNATVWQSFDQPTDTLLQGQKLRVGQKLTASKSATSMSEQGLLSLSLTSEGLFAQMATDPPQVYFSKRINFTDTGNDSNYVKFTRGNLALFVNYERHGYLLSHAKPFADTQLLKFEYDGHLRAFRQDANALVVADDTLGDYVYEYPTVCGNYGICDMHGECRCPDRYFDPIDGTDARLGCSERVPLSCEASQSQSFMDMGGISYFTFRVDPDIAPDLRNTDEKSCKKACQNNCSCRAAFFRVGKGSNYSGFCYLVSQVFSLIHQADYDKKFIAFLKVQTPHREIPIPNITGEPSPYPNFGNAKAVRIAIIASSLGSLLAFVFLAVIIKRLCINRGIDEDKGVNTVEEDYLDQVPGAPKRFTFDDLKTITEDFSKMLAKGGFSSVYEGTLANGTKVAVKHLDGFCQTMKSFLAEVESIGSIHHVNLVQLVGFCAENCHRLLVYEYMSRGSLDKWIYHKSDESFVLNWQQRRNIICDVAKGLTYLHEECRWKIVHMDIKPHNILLDEKFNAKVADFGLFKLIDRDQSQIFTIMRGTSGYLAPEWLHSAITEKVDVYSFGVVILEMICGRRVFDASQNLEDAHLLEVFERKNEEGRLLDMIDKNSEDMQMNEHLGMMRLAAWCLQVDFTKWASMSAVIKVLEEVMEVPDDLDYNFSLGPLKWVMNPFSNPFSRD